MSMQLVSTSLQCSGPPLVQLACKHVHVLQPRTKLHYFVHKLIWMQMTGSPMREYGRTPWQIFQVLEFFSFFFFSSLSFPPNDSPRTIPVSMKSKVSLHELFWELLLSCVIHLHSNTYGIFRHMTIGWLQKSIRFETLIRGLDKLLA